MCVRMYVKIPNCGKKWKIERWETTCKSESRIANKYAEEKLQYIKYILCERPEEMKQLYKIRVRIAERKHTNPTGKRREAEAEWMRQTQIEWKQMTW